MLREHTLLNKRTFTVLNIRRSFIIQIYRTWQKYDLLLCYGVYFEVLSNGDKARSSWYRGGGAWTGTDGRKIVVCSTGGVVTSMRDCVPWAGMDWRGIVVCCPGWVRCIGAIKRWACDGCGIADRENWMDGKLAGKPTSTGASMSMAGSMKTREGHRRLSCPDSWQWLHSWHQVASPRVRSPIVDAWSFIGAPDCDLASFEGERVAKSRRLHDRGC